MPNDASDNWGGYGSPQAMLQARAQKDQGDFNADTQNTQKIAAANPGSYQAYQDYIKSQTNPGNFLQQGYNFLSNPQGALGIGPSNGQLTNPLGIDMTGGKGVVNPGMTYEQFASMTDADWAQFKTMSKEQQDAFLKNKTGAQGASDPGADQEAAYQKWRGQVMGQMQQFAAKMNMSVDDLMKSGDLGVKTAEGTGVRSAGMGNLAAGMSGGGGLSVQNTQKSAMDSMNAYVTQRQQIGANALNNVQQGLGSMAHDTESIREYNQGLNLQLQQAKNAAYMAQYQQGQSQQSGLFGLAGGIIGGIYGGPGGAAAGNSIGQGVGGSMYGQNNRYNPPGYSYPGSGSPGLGGGGYNPNAYKPNGQ